MCSCAIKIRMSHLGVVSFSLISLLIWFSLESSSESSSSWSSSSSSSLSMSSSLLLLLTNNYFTKTFTHKSLIPIDIKRCAKSASFSVTMSIFLTQIGIMKMKNKKQNSIQNLRTWTSVSFSVIQWMISWKFPSKTH